MGFAPSQDSGGGSELSERLFFGAGGGASSFLGSSVDPTV